MLTFGSVRKKLDELGNTAQRVVAQVNPFDQGKTFSNYNQRVAQDRAARTQLQQRAIQSGVRVPSYGKGLTGAFNAVRDVYDANTPMDRYRRNMEALKTPSPLKPAPLNETYADQQRRQGIGRVSNNVFQRGTNTARAFAEGFKEAPDAFGRGFGQLTGTAQRARDAEAAQQQATLESMQRAVKQRELTRDPVRRAALRQQIASQGKLQREGYKQFQTNQRQLMSDTDPRKMAAATASMLFDVGTLGVGTSVGQAVKQTGRQALKTVGKQAVKAGGMASVSGALSPVIQAGKDAKLSDVARGAVGGFAFGAALPGVTYGVSKKLSRSASKAAQNLVEPPRSMKAIAKADPEVQRIERQLTRATANAAVARGREKANLVSEAQELIRLRNARIQEISRGGFVQTPGGKKPRVSKKLQQSTEPADIAMRESLAGKNRPQGAVEIEANQAMGDAARLRATGGDMGQAAVGSDPQALAKARAKMQAEISKKSQVVNPEAPEMFQVPRNQTPIMQRAPLNKSELAAIKGEPVRPKAKGKEKVAIQKRNTDMAIQELAANLGIDLGEATNKLGLPAKAIKAATGGRYTTTRGLNPFRAASDAAGEAFAERAEKAITGKGSRSLRAAEGVFAGTGRTATTKQIPRKFEGALANISDLVKRTSKETTELLDNTPEARKQLELVMRDNTYLNRVYGAKRQSPDTLPPALRDVYDRYTNANKMINDLNLQTGVIDKKQWARGTKGEWVARRFDIPKTEQQSIREHVKALFDQTAGIKRKDINEMSDELIALLEKDPIRAIEFRAEMAMRNLAFTEALDALKAKNLVQATRPNEGFVQLKGQRFGKYSNQWIDRTAYEQLTSNRVFLNDTAQSFSNLLDTYQRSGMGQLDRIQKAFKTTLNLGTNVQNALSNPLVFNIGAGTNPITQLYDMVGAARQMAQGITDGDVRLARQLGVIGGDTGRILTGSSNKQASALAGDEGVGLARKALSKAGRIYAAVDDTAKLGLFNRLRKQGLPDETAALEVAKFTQDYNNVGRTVQLIADSPVVGKPFARFSPELVRIIKNNVTRAPHRIMAGVAGLAFMANKLSADAGEPPEERRVREEAVGQTLIPGTSWINKAMGGPDRDVSLNLPLNSVGPETAVNIARMVGLNFPQEPGADANQALIEQLIPVEIPVRKNAIGETVFDPTKIVTSMTLRPFVEQIFDQNFIGKQISDPTNVTYDSQGNVQKFTPPSTGEQLVNRGLSLASSMLPMGYEATSIAAALMGRPGVTGKERSIPDSLMRAVGIKAEKNDPATRAKKTETAEFFEVTKPAQDKFLRENKDLESLYFDIYPKTKDRTTGKKISDQIGPEKWSRVYSDTSGRMFNFMKQQAIEANKRDKAQPVDPIYTLPDAQARQALELRTRPTGDDIEREQILRATTDWYPKLEQAERKYYKDLESYFAKLKKQGVDIDSSMNDRVKAYNNIEYPQQPKLLTEYYKIREKNPDAAKAYLKQFDSNWVSSQFDADKQARLKWINAKRKIEGFDPISWETYSNKTYGFKESGGTGTGGYGRRARKGSKSARELNKYQYELNKGTGIVAAPTSTIRKTAPPKPKVAAKAVGKPKVSVKRSKV